MLMGSMPYIAFIDMGSLPQVVMNGNRIRYVDSVKNLGVTITPTLTWDLLVGKIQAKVYGSLKSLNFRRRSLSFEMKKQLVQASVMPHFDYASVVYIYLDKTRGKSLQVAHNACVRFVTSYVPFIPLVDVKSHITHCRLKLGWLSLTGHRFLQLLVLFYRIVSPLTTCIK